MGLITHGLAAGCGYLLGRADGRARLARVGRRAADLAQRPEVVRVRKRGQDLVKNQAHAVKQKVAVRSDDAEPADDGLRARTWRSRFSRSKTVHFPSSAEARAAQLGGTAAVEDPEAPLCGAAVPPRPETPTSPTH
jgi:hypothetical protein